MLIAAHSISAGVVGEVVENPILAFLLGFILHFILDAIPHFDSTDGGKFTKRQIALLAIDGTIGLAVLIYLFFNSSHQLSFVAGVFGGLLPDMLDNVPWWEDKFRKSKFGKVFHAFHDYIQLIKLKPVLGLSVQCIIVFLSIYIFLTLR